MSDEGDTLMREAARLAALTSPAQVRDMLLMCAATMHLRAEIASGATRLYSADFVNKAIERFEQMAQSLAERDGHRIVDKVRS